MRIAPIPCRTGHNIPINHLRISDIPILTMILTMWPTLCVCLGQWVKVILSLLHLYIWVFIGIWPTIKWASHLRRKQNIFMPWISLLHSIHMLLMKYRNYTVNSCIAPMLCWWDVPTSLGLKQQWHCSYPIHSDLYMQPKVFMMNLHGGENGLREPPLSNPSSQWQRSVNVVHMLMPVQELVLGLSSVGNGRLGTSHMHGNARAKTLHGLRPSLSSLSYAHSFPNMQQDHTSSSMVTTKVSLGHGNTSEANPTKLTSFYVVSLEFAKMLTLPSMPDMSQFLQPCRWPISRDFPRCNMAPCPSLTKRCPGQHH